MRIILFDGVRWNSQITLSSFPCHHNSSFELTARLSSCPVRGHRDPWTPCNNSRRVKEMTWCSVKCPSYTTSCLLNGIKLISTFSILPPHIDCLYSQTVTALNSSRARARHLSVSKTHSLGLRIHECQRSSLTRDICSHQLRARQTTKEPFGAELAALRSRIWIRSFANQTRSLSRVPFQKFQEAVSSCFCCSTRIGNV